ncbi:unnamed protein product [Staurois parvus]|uniref:Uncharacterized protein n=1 Tax=Staurois parvus TaxID=386267 RepID=A0ABN9C2P9_9NEOB|nr:unnamed protein product [Staurois parvus]
MKVIAFSNVYIYWDFFFLFFPSNGGDQRLIVGLLQAC